MCAPDIPDTSAAQRDAIASQERIANRNLELQDKMLTYFTDRQSTVDAVEKVTRERQLAQADETAAQGRDVFNYQKEVFRPVEESLVAQAMQESTPAYYEKYASEAATRIAQQQAVAAGTTERDLASMGVNPNSGAYIAASRGLQIENAAQRASGMNSARDSAENLGWARRADVAGIGKGLVGAGNASYGLALEGNRGAMSGATAATQTAASTLGTPIQYGQAGMQASMNAGQLANDIYKAQAGAASSDNSGNQAIGAIGTAAAMYF